MICHSNGLSDSYRFQLNLRPFTAVYKRCFWLEPGFSYTMEKDEKWKEKKRKRERSGLLASATLPVLGKAKPVADLRFLLTFLSCPSLQSRNKIQSAVCFARYGLPAQWAVPIHFFLAFGLASTKCITLSFPVFLPLFSPCLAPFRILFRLLISFLFQLTHLDYTNRWHTLYNFSLTNRFSCFVCFTVFLFLGSRRLLT